MKTIELSIQEIGKKTGVIVKPKIYLRKLRVRGKTYVEKDRKVVCYVPKEHEDKLFIIIPVDKDELEVLSKAS